MLLSYSTIRYSILIVAIFFNLLRMSSKRKGRRRLPMSALVIRQSKASTLVNIQNQNVEVHEGIQSLCDSAASLLEVYPESPTKRARKKIMDTADTLLYLQEDMQQKIPQLVPSDCTKYAIGRLQSVSNYKQKVHNDVTSPRQNMRLRYFYVADRSIVLPHNIIQYTALEACKILEDIEKEVKASSINDKKGISLRKTIQAMRNYCASPSDEVTPLIPVTRSGMFRIFKKYKDNGVISWPKMGRPPILNNDAFLSSFHEFGKDECRAIGKKDLTEMLNSAKKEVAKAKGNSTTIFNTPTKRTVNNYISLIPQLDPSRTMTATVQQKSEARYIAERSFRNAVSFILTVALTHYQLGIVDSRLHKIDKATTGAKLLYDMIQKENECLDLRPILPMFTSTTDDTTVFAFEGAVDGSEGEGFIICKDDDTGTRSSYTKSTASTDSKRGIRIRHTVTFNALGNAAPFYATVYGLSAEELPVSTCPSGLLPVLLSGFFYGGDQDISNKTKGWLVFIRSTNKEIDVSTDQLNHEYYRNEVFLPYIEETRATYLRRECWTPGDEVEDDHVWVGWQVSIVIIPGCCYLLVLVL